MAENNAIDEAYLESIANKQASALDNVLANQTETLDQLVNRKKEDLGLKSEEKIADFVSQTISFDDITDADTLRNFGRLYGGEGDYSFDAYENAKYDPETKELLPYLGSVEPKEGTKRSKKWDLHRKAYAKMNGMRDYTMVSQRMLNEEADKQTENFKAALLKGQDPESGQINVDIREDGVGYFGRPLITIRNPETGEIINEVMNTAENNAMFYSKYNRDSYIEGVQELEEAQTNYNSRKYSGEGFWVSAGKGLSSGVDGLQATGWGMAALIADAIPGTLGENTASWFIKQYLRNLDEAQANGAGLPSVENVDWSNPNEVLSKLGALIGEAMPSIALMIGTGGIGGLVAKSAQIAAKAGVKSALQNTTKNAVSSKTKSLLLKMLPKTVAGGRAAGAYTGAMVLETGGIYGDVAAAGNRDWKAIGGSLAGGVVAGALEAFYPIKLMKKLGMGKAAKSQINKSVDKTVLKNSLGANFRNVGKELLSGGLTEGTTEMLQFVVEEVTQDLIKEGHLPDMNSAEFRSGLLNSFVAGLVPGSTFSGATALIGETSNRLAGDQGATAKSIIGINEEVAKDTNEVDGGVDQTSVDNLVNNVENLEKQAEKLGITLPEDYATKVPIERAVILSDALNQAAIEQKAGDKGKVNPEVLAARKEIEASLDAVKTGNAGVDARQQQKRINENKDRQINAIKANVERQIKEKTPTGRKKTKSAIANIKAAGAKKIAKQEAMAETALAKVKGTSSRISRAGSTAARTNIVNASNRIRNINKRLKNPNLSKRARKILQRERNQLGVLINNVTASNRPSLPKNVIARGEKAIKSFYFENKKTETKSKEETAAPAEQIDIIIKEIEEERNKANRDENVEAKLKERLIGEFEKLLDNAAQLQKDIDNTTDKKLKKELEARLAAVNKRVDEIIDTVEKFNDPVETVNNAAEDKLNSLDINDIIEGVEDDILGSIDKPTEEQEENKNIRDRLQKLRNEIEKKLKANSSKGMLDVDSEIIEGSQSKNPETRSKFLGLKWYLSKATTDSKNFPDTKFNNFITNLALKLKAWEDAYKIFTSTNETVFVKWDTLDIYASREALLKDFPNIKKKGKGYVGFWFIDADSKPMIDLLNIEVEFAKEVKELVYNVIGNESNRKVKAKASDTNSAINIKLRKVIRVKPADKGSLDNVTGNQDKGKPAKEVVKPVKKDAVSKEELIKLFDATKVLKDEARRINESWMDTVDNADIDSEIFYAENVIPAKIALLEAQIAYEEALLKNKASKNLEKSIADNKAKIEDFNKEIEEIKNPKEKVSTETVKKLQKAVDAIQNRIDLRQARIDNKSYPETLSKTEVENKIKFDKIKLKAERVLLKAAKKLVRGKKNANNVLNKFKDKFNGLIATKLTINDLFEVRDQERDSFFSNNSDTVLTAKSIKTKLWNQGVRNLDYIKAVQENFVKFKKAFNEDVNFELTEEEKTKGVYLKQGYRIFLDKDGNMPDEIIFAMMLNTMHQAAIHEKASKFNPRYYIANLVFGDPKQVGRLTRQHMEIFGNVGIFTKNLASDIGQGMFNTLNLSGSKPSEQELLDETFRRKLGGSIKKLMIKDARIESRIATSLGLLAIQTARRVNADIVDGQPQNGLFDFKAGRYQKSLFDNPNLTASQDDGTSTLPLEEQYIKMNSVIIKENEELEIFKDNLDEFEKIIGAKVNISDISTNKVETVQEKTRGSFFKLNAIAKDLILKLQAVVWAARPDEIGVFQLLSKDTLKIITGLKNLDEQHDSQVDAVESANKEKELDIQYINDHINKRGLEGFYFRYRAQVMHRMRIDSTTINPQRSKIMRALFGPINGTTSTISSASDRAVFQIALGQAFGHSNKTMADAISIFKLINENNIVMDLVAELKKGKPNKALFNKLLRELMQNKEIVDGPSMHLVEGLVALSKYSETKSFDTSLGIETDGTTNGYAIGVLQFLDGTPEELKDALARVGVFVDKESAYNTYEKFVAGKQDDTYQVFGRRIADAIKLLSLKQQNAIALLHGEFENAEGELQSFARDLAKNPVMISNYGAGLAKVINQILDNILPDLYKRFASLQTEYNNATTEESKQEIRNKVQEIEDSLRDDLKLGYPKGSIVRMLDATGVTENAFGKEEQNNLYGINLEKQKYFIKNYFKDIYAPIKENPSDKGIFEDALDDLLKPIAESRDIITKIVEAGFMMFQEVFNAEIEGISGTGMLDTSVKMHIAGQLAEQYMPRMDSPWSDSNNSEELMQLIRLVEEVNSRVQIKTKPFNNAQLHKFTGDFSPVYKTEYVDVIINGEQQYVTDPNTNEFKYNSKGKKIKLTTEVEVTDKDGNKVPITEDNRILSVGSTSSKFQTPGVAAIINQVQNMDSVMLGDLLLSNINVTPIFDAVISSINDAIPNKNKYNEQFLRRNLSHVFLEQSLKQFETLIENYSKTTILNEKVDTDKQATIDVWSKNSDGANFSNLTARPFNYQGRRYISVEHAYQTLKSGTFNEEVFNLAWRNKTKLTIRTNIVDPKISITLMEELMYESFRQNIAVQKELLATGNAKFTHNIASDIWKDEFPRILMKVREQIKRRNKINNKLRFESFRGKQLVNSLKNPTLTSIQRSELMLELQSLTIESYLENIKERIQSRKDNLIALLAPTKEEGFGNADGLSIEKLNNLKTEDLNDLVIRSWVSSQMYLPESAEDSSLAPDIAGESNVGSETDEKFNEEPEVVTSQVDPENANTNEFNQISKPIKPKNPKFTNNKAFINLIKRRGGINPNSTLGKELKAQDITNKSMPGLFKNNSTNGDFDNLPLEELIADGFFPENDDNDYASYDWVFGRIVDEVGGVAGLTDEDQLIKDQYEEAIEQYEIELKNYNDQQPDLFDDDTLQSIDVTVQAELEKEVYQTSSLRKNLQAIFDRLGKVSISSYLSKTDKDAQQTHLQRVLDEIISKAGTILDETKVTLNASNIRAEGEANFSQTSIQVNYNKFSPISYSQQNSQEVYTHELLHILTRYALRTDSRLGEKLRRIRTQVKKEIENTEKNPYEIFLHKDAKGGIIYLTDKQAEIDAAKAQYAYLFGDKVPAKAVLDEFLAYSMTNPFMVKKLETIQSQKVDLWSKDPQDTITEKLMKFFVEIVDRIGNLLSGETLPRNVQEEVFRLTKDIVHVNQTKRDKLGRALKADKLGKYIDQGNDIVTKFAADVASGAIKKGSDAYIAAVDRITKDGKINNFLADLLYDTKLIAYFGSSYKDFVDNHPKVQERLNSAFRNFKPKTLKGLSSLKADLFGSVDQDFVKLLYKSHKEVDGNRKNYKEITAEQLQKTFKSYDTLTYDEKASITKVFLKTDLAALVNSKEFTVEDLVDLIKDEAKLEKVLKEYKNKLNINSNKYYDIGTESLANYMVTGESKGHMLALNALVLYKDNKKKAYLPSEKLAEVRDLDIYISLLALSNENLKHAKSAAIDVIDREFNFDEDSATHNGIHGLVNLHVAFKRESEQDGFFNRVTQKSEPELMQKGYIANVTDPDAQLTVEPDDEVTKAEMIRQNYVFIGRISLTPDKKNNQTYGLYVHKNDPELPRTKGIVSMTSKQFKGTSFKEILARNPDMEGTIMANLEAFAKSERKKARKNVISGEPTMIPIRDGEGNVVDFRITLSHANSEKYLDQDLSFDEVLPTMYSHLQDKIKSEEINREAIKLLYEYGKNNRSKNPSKFVNILDLDLQEEYYTPLPKQAKYHMLELSRVNPKTGAREFWVERGVLDTVFGYRNPSISNIGFVKDMPKTKRYLKISEKLVKEMVSLAVVNVVIKIPIVPAVNYLSNFVTSALYGVPPTYLFKKWAEGTKELNRYRNDVKELKLLDIEILSNPKMQNNARIDKKREILVDNINTNKVAKLVDKGLFNSITEDINQNEFTYRNKAFNKLKQKGNKLVTAKVFDIANHAYLGEHTAIFKASMHFLQTSDFVARYALYSYQTEVKKVPEDKAWKTMVETFVNYDQPLNRFVAYGNDIGAILFVKYWLRIQRAGINLIKEKPLNVGMFFAGSALLGVEIETILNSNLLAGNFMPTLGGFEKIFEEVFIPPGVEILTGEGFS